MAHKNIDRCKETTSTTGTGNLTLTGAASGFVTVASGLTTNGDTGWFCAEAGTQWEIFLGTRVSATELARTTVISSSNAGAAVSFTAAPVVFSTVPGVKMSAVGPSLSAYRATSDQGTTSATWTKVQLNAELFDTGSCFDSTTNYRFQPNVDGYYQVAWCIHIGAASGLTGSISALYKNGAIIANGTFTPGVSSVDSMTVGTKLVYLNGTTDYLELFGLAYGTTIVFKFGDDATYLTAHFVCPG